MEVYFRIVTRDHTDRMTVVQEHPIPDSPEVWEDVRAAIKTHEIVSRRSYGIGVDADGDGIEDRLTMNTSSWSIHLSSDGSSPGSILQPGLSVPHSAGADDIDADGFIDPWISDPADGTLWILFGDVENKFKKKQRILGGWVARGAFLDMDEDGDLDFVSDGFNDGGGDYIRWYWVEMELNQS